MNPSLMHPLEQIENELKALQNEVKKKSSAISQLVTEALQALAAYKSVHKDNIIPDKFPIDAIIKPILQTPSFKSPNIIAQSLGVVQRLISHSCISASNLQQVLQFLAALVEIPEDKLQIKVLQTLLLFVNPKNLDFSNADVIELLFNLCLQLFNSKDVIIHNTSSAAIFQLTTLVFDKYIAIVKDYDEKQPANYSNNPVYMVCVKLFRELVMLASGSRPSWVPTTVTSPKSIGIDLVNSVLKQTGAYLKNSKEITNCIRKELVPLLQSSFRQKNTDFLFLLRIHRASVRILVSMAEGIDLVEQMLLLLHDTETDYVKYLVLETLNILLSQPNLIILFNERSSSANTLFSEIINSLLNTCKALTSLPENDFKKTHPLNPKLSKVLENNYTDLETQNISSSTLWKSTIDCLTSLTESFGLLCKQNKIPLGTLFDMSTATPEQTKLKEWIGLNWKAIHKCLKEIVPRNTDEVFTQQILNTVQSWINITGTLQITTARDSLLLTLCQACVPNETNKEIGTQHIQTSKILFNIAHGLGGLLDVNSWHIILSTLQKTDSYIKKIQSKHLERRTPRTTNPEKAVSGGADEEFGISVDLQILSSALESLFEQSQHYSKEHLIAFLEALNQLTLEYMEKITTTSESLNADGLNAEAKSRLFGLSRMLDTIRVNLYRLDLFWDLAVAHFVCIANSKNPSLRLYGVENLSHMILNGFNYIIANHDPKEEEESKGSGSPKKLKYIKTGKFSEELWQQTLFQPWLDICNTKFAEMKEAILGAILKILQNSGHDINSAGWTAILTIMCEISEENLSSSSMTGFKCLDKIVNDYLQDLPVDCISKLLAVMENFQKAATDNNVSYSSLNMFWNIADFVNRKQLKEGKPYEEYGAIWTNLLEKLSSLCTNRLLEVRHSGIHIFASILVQYSLSLTPALWRKIITEMVFKLADQLIQEYLAATRALAQSATTPKRTSINDGEDIFTQKANSQKQWEDTIILFIQNFTKIMKKYLTLIEQQQKDDEQKQSIAVLEEVLGKMKHIMYVGRNEIVVESAKFLHEFVIAAPAISTKVLPAIFDIFEAVKKWLQEVRQDSKEIKNMINKFTPEVLETLVDLFSPSKPRIVDPDNNPYEHHIFEVLEKAIFYLKQAETLNTITPLRVMLEDKYVYEFIENIPSNFNINSPKFGELYFKFLNGMLGLTIMDKQTEQIVRRFLGILDNNISKNTIKQEKYYTQLPSLFEKLQKIMRLRTSNEYWAYIGHTPKDSTSIWLYATEIFLKIAEKTLGKTAESQNKMHADVEAGGMSEKSLPDHQIEDSIIVLFENVLADSGKITEQASKSSFSEIKKDWYEMDVKLMNAVTDLIAPYCHTFSRERLWKLISVLENVATVYSKNNAFEDPSPTMSKAPSNKIAKASIEILFKFSGGFADIASDNQESNKLYLSRFATKKLILKCKQIINTFVVDEKKSGSSLLPRHRVTEVVHILERLKELSVPENSFEFADSLQGNEISIESPQLKDHGEFEVNSAKIKVHMSESGGNSHLIQGKKGHLIYLFQLLSELIRSKESEVKDVLADIFIEISKTLGFVSLQQ